jgi:predicted naringenin-chalcone synthase
VGCSDRVNERALYEVHKSASVVIPDTLRQMDWILSRSGMIIGLGKEIPQHIYDHMPSFIQDLLSNTEAYGVDLNHMNYALHPGGRLILDSIQDALDIDSSYCISSWEILRRFGNMSSATLGMCDLLSHVICTATRTHNMDS